MITGQNAEEMRILQHPPVFGEQGNIERTLSCEQTNGVVHLEDQTQYLPHFNLNDRG